MIRKWQAWRQVSLNNKLIVIFTLVIAVSNALYIVYASKQWKVMRGQLAESAKELELSERPWVDAEISLNGPFTFDPNGANIPLKIVLQNSGRSPALKTAVDVEPILGFMGNPVDFYRKQACQQAAALGSFGESLFPGRNSEYDINAGIS